MPVQQLKALAHDAKQPVRTGKVVLTGCQLSDDAFLSLQSSLRAKDDPVDARRVVEVKGVAAGDEEAHQIIDQHAAVERLRKDRSWRPLLSVLVAVSGQEEEGDRATGEAVADGINWVVTQLVTKHCCGETVADGGQ